jgi:hypothetical protein
MQYDPLELALLYEQNGYSKGGKVVDFLVEVLKGGSKPTDTKRRAAMGLPKDLTPKPGEVVVKEEVKTAPKKGETSVSMTEAMNIPMSRRDVLRAGAGQAANAMAPRGALGSLMQMASSPMNLARSIAPPAGSSTLQGLIAQALARGMSEEDLVKLAAGVRPDLQDFEVLYLSDLMRAPTDFMHEFADQAGPLANMRSMLNVPEGTGIKSALREIRGADPKMYEGLKQAARDISDLSMEP